MPSGSEGMSWAAWPIVPYGPSGGILLTDWITPSYQYLKYLNTSVASYPAIAGNQTATSPVFEVSTGFNNADSFYMGSYDSYITQWLYNTVNRTIEFQGTYVAGAASAPSWLSFSDDFKYVYATNEYLNRVQVSLLPDIRSYCCYKS